MLSISTHRRAAALWASSPPCGPDPAVTSVILSSSFSLPETQDRRKIHPSPSKSSKKMPKPGSVRIGNQSIRPIQDSPGLLLPCSTPLVSAAFPRHHAPSGKRLVVAVLLPARAVVRPGRGIGWQARAGAPHVSDTLVCGRVPRQVFSVFVRWFSQAPSGSCGRGGHELGTWEPPGPRPNPIGLLPSPPLAPSRTAPIGRPRSVASPEPALGRPTGSPIWVRDPTTQSVRGPCGQPRRGATVSPRLAELTAFEAAVSRLVSLAPRFWRPPTRNRLARPWGLPAGPVNPE